MKMPDIKIVLSTSAVSNHIQFADQEKVELDNISIHRLRKPVQHCFVFISYIYVN